MECNIKARDRQRKCRAKKKVRQERSNTTKATSPIPFSTPLPNINPCNTTQSYGKAVARSRKALPMSPPPKVSCCSRLGYRCCVEFRDEKIEKFVWGSKICSTRIFLSTRYLIHHARFKWAHNSMGWFQKEETWEILPYNVLKRNT